MPCYNPLKGYKSKTRNESGKRSIVFNPRDGYNDMPIAVPCGQCIGCRLEKSRQWAIRCVHEASLHEDNIFITLTYNDENLPNDNSLNKKHFQLFMKRLRKKYPDCPIKYFHCGEYGEQLNRPHYHACIFNFTFQDKYLYAERNGLKIYRSKTLEKLWPFGFSTIGEVTFESAAYVARYITKKVTGEKAIDHYTIADPETGELFQLQPEYATMSTRPPIGKGWYEKFKTDAYPSDFIIVRGKKMKPPKFYDKLFEEEQPQEHLNIKAKRTKMQEKNKGEQTTQRLMTREKVKKAQLTTLTRNLENL